MQGLQPGTSYRVRVLAHSEAGAGASSQVSIISLLSLQAPLGAQGVTICTVTSDFRSKFSSSSQDLLDSSPLGNILSFASLKHKLNRTEILCLVIIIIITGDHCDHAARGGGPPRPRQPHRQAHLRLLHPGHVGRPRGFYFRFRQEQDHQVQALSQTGELFNSFLAPPRVFILQTITQY